MKNILIIAFLFAGILGWAQNETKAKEILDKVSATNKAYKSITADFTFSMQNASAGINETNKGSIILQKDKYKLNLSGFEIYCDGKTQWTYMKEASEVNISDANSDEPDAINPATIFTIYEKGYKYNYIGEGSSSGISTHKIELIPSDRKDFIKVVLEINKTGFQIVSAVMHGKDGNKYTIQIGKYVTDKTYPEASFKFDKTKFPGVDVIDMR
jgi:outer membrane lipoprotein-sorting protein